MGESVINRTPRLYHMDAVRCFCMLFGLLLHGATIGNTPFFSLIKLTSDHFRMAAFFLVSGYFSAMVCARMPWVTFFRNRSRLVLVPFICGVLILNPITIWLIQLYHGGGESFVSFFFNEGWRLPAPGPVVWHLHLWFLVSLFIFTALTPAFFKLAGSSLVQRVVNRMEGMPGFAQLMIVTFGLIGGVLFFRTLNDQLLSKITPWDAGFIVMASSNYISYFVVGIFAFRHKMIYEAMHRFMWPGLLLFLALHLAHPLFADHLPRALERTVFWISRSGLIFLIVCTMLGVARKLVTKGSPILSRLTDGVYTFYIFHFLVIYVLANVMKMVSSNIYVIFTGVVLLGFPLLFLIHERLVARSAILSFMFNGKALSRQVARA